MHVNPTAEAAYGGRVRVRVGALVLDERQPAVLLVEHAGIWTPDPFWTPPGGGVHFGEALDEALRREVREETGLEVDVGPLRYVLDFVRPPLHAVSFYFECRAPAGLAALAPGRDPELAADRQVSRCVRFVGCDELAALQVDPEGRAEWLQADAPGGFPAGTRYVGTLR